LTQRNKSIKILIEYNFLGFTVLTFSAPYIVGIGGTPRAGSNSEMAIRNTLRFAQDMGARTDILCSSDLVIKSYVLTVEVCSHNAQRSL